MSAPTQPCPEDDPSLREALKRCSPETYQAACAFRRYGRNDDLRRLVRGVIERFVERDRRAMLEGGEDAVRLREDLDIDSLTMMEAVMVTEEVLGISVSNEELTQLRSLADVQAFIWTKTSSRPTPVNGTGRVADVPDNARRIESGA